jgi:poly(3-hydroxybutyrate) depolymerase
MLKMTQNLKRSTVYLFICCILFACCNTGNEPETLNLHQGINNVQIEHDGLSRSLYIILPYDFQPEMEYPVLFFFHGLGGNRDWGREILLDLISGGENFIGISPQGIDDSWNAGSGAVPSTADDVGFTLEILDLLDRESTVNIKNDQIYSMGYSNGGAFSYCLALSTDRFAAIASLSASFFEGRIISPEVSKISVYHLHGDQDLDVPFNGGQSISLDIIFQSARETVLKWVRHNEIEETPRITRPEDSFVLYRYKDAGNPYEVLLAVLENTTHNIGTHPYIYENRVYFEIWEFFKRHPKQ